MTFEIPLSSAGCCAVALVSIVVGYGSAQADGVDPNIPVTDANCSSLQPQMPKVTYAAKPGDVLASANPAAQIKAKGNVQGNLFWQLGSESGCTSGGLFSVACGLNASSPPSDPLFSVEAPDDNNGDGHAQTVPVQLSNIRPIVNSDIGRQGSFSVTASTADRTCTWHYNLRVVGSGGGWGDPHMTTVDGVSYDFQSAGEFTALYSDDFEVQTRQRPVSTATVPGANDHTGLAVCVSIYSAVAVRIGSNRVTVQPRIGRGRDTGSLELRVNGKLVTLTAGGIDLRAGGSSDPKAELEGRVVKTAEGYEFKDVKGTQLIVTQTYWAAQETWYLTLNVYQTTANQGIWGVLAEKSWLPALPDGTSLGPRPAAPSDRYDVLYETFADAWRVTDKTSLFDYAAGTATADFTRREWPRFEASSCSIEKQRPAEPARRGVAEEACGGITDEVRKANCIFDVSVTGETGFARAYKTMEKIRPHGMGWQPAVLAGRKPDRR